MKKIWIVFASSVCALLLNGCAKSLNGTWEREEGSTLLTMEFADDGTAVYSLGSYQAEGTWSVDGDTLTLSFASLADQSAEYTWEIDGKTLTLTDENGVATEFSESD